MSKDKFKINDRVKFVNRLAHERDPKFYPPVGTTGTIVQCDGDGYPKVRWDDEHDHNRVKFLNDQYLALVPDSSKVLIMIDKKDPAKVVARDLSSNKTGEARCNPGDEFDFFIGAAIALGRLFGHEPELTSVKPKPAPCKFKVGDKIIGNAKANRYVVTREGWTGTVTEILLKPEEGDGCDKGLMTTFVARGEDENRYWLSDDAFDLYEEPKCFFAKESKLWNAKLVCVYSGVRWWKVGRVYPVTGGVVRDDEGDKRTEIDSIDTLHQKVAGYARFIELKE